jgi:hypothetical protein
MVWKRDKISQNPPEIQLTILPTSLSLAFVIRRQTTTSSERRLMKNAAFSFTSAIAIGLSIFATISARANVVYDNSTTDLSLRFNPGLAEVGDEISLLGGAATITNFTFQYWGLSLGVSAQARVRFYANDGAPSPAGPLKPNSLLFDSDWFNVATTERNTLIFDDFTTGALVPLTGELPGSFTWSVQFQNLGGGSAGVDLYDPPTIGGNYNEYWDNDGVNGWQYRGTNSPNINFAARISAVPEPTVIGLGLLGGLGVLFLRNRFLRR